MDNRMAVAQQIVRDVLAERPPTNGGVFRMRAVEPDDMPAERVALARRYASMVPDGITEADVVRVAAAIAPFLTSRAAT